ncbi:MAG: glycogen synthase GlgA [Streptococcaceae bacterium]|jgi:starch synthase|nr:glycogen synthase GlgA [Streptococcaceae bacterium]
MKILFAASECAPFFKTGGLGDVVGALPKELAKKGQDVQVVLPLFSGMKKEFRDQLEFKFYDFVNIGWRRQFIGVNTLVKDGVKYIFLENEQYFGRPELYGYLDDGERWAWFQLAVCQLLERFDWIPDILHVNDFHTAMIPFLLKEKYRWINAYHKIHTVLTIHNIEFQGAMDPNVLSDLFGMGMERFYDGTVEQNGALNFLKAGILYADRVTTVSPSYAKEIQTPEFGNGLDPILRFVSGKLSGILNGIDYDIYNPETDKYLIDHFSVKNMSGKQRAKAHLQQRMGLPVDAGVPLIGMVSRLTSQKGFDLMLSQMDRCMLGEAQFVLIGTGYASIENGFRYFAEKYPDKFACNIAFDLQLAQEIYAGSDYFLMPSAFEPCGLSQMIAMRYGTLPIVHEIGGLKDTVIPYNPISKEGTGFGFVDFNGDVLYNALKRAVKLYWDQPKTIDKLRQNAMSQDFSWTSKANSYLELYQKI